MSITERINRVAYSFSQHWLLWAGIVIGLYVFLPWLAPLLMELGWTSAGNAIYTIYATQCHQLPQRSFFLFGQETMYSLADIQAVTAPTNNPIILRRFVGNATMGWKVAWSDRMVSMYTSMFFGVVIYAGLRHRTPKLPMWGFILLCIPMGIDGVTHMISDFTGGIGYGFRDDNAWLALLTRNIFPASFYAGDALGSFNSWMRLITGILFGLGTVWLAFPYMEESFQEVNEGMQSIVTAQPVTVQPPASDAP